jgi:site-specific recombinase XerD
VSPRAARNDKLPPSGGGAVGPVNGALQSIGAVGGALTEGSLTLTLAARSYLRWMEAHGYAQNTLRSYGFALSEFLRYASGVKLVKPSDVTILALDGYYAWLQAHGASARTASHRRTVLIGLWAWLEHEGFADRNVAAKTFRIKYTKRLPAYLEPHEIDAFLTGMSKLTDLSSRRDYAVVACLFYGGLRVGELVALRVSSVDLVARRIKVLHGKGDRDRTIVLPPRLAPILNAYLTETRPALVGRLMGRVHKTRSGQWRMRFTQDGRKIDRATGATTEAEARRILAQHAPQPTDAGFLFVNASPANTYRLARDGKPLSRIRSPCHRERCPMAPA